jgi:hypothetical protein
MQTFIHMNPAKVVFLALAFMFFTPAGAQQTNRSDICQRIPDLNIEQQQKIDKLSLAHQKKMDELRIQFRSESDVQLASSLKTQMNAEMQKHYQNITALLTVEQKTWYDQNCSASYTRGSYPRNGLGRGGRAYGRRQGAGRGAGYGAGQGTGYGAGYGAGRGAGRARCRYVY